MPSLDVVVSVYRETGAPALYAALATIHGRAPLRLAVFLHDGAASSRDRTRSSATTAPGIGPYASGVDLSN